MNDTITTETPIVVRPLPGNMTTRWNCSLCPRGTDKTDAPYGYVDGGGEHFICESCVEAIRNGTLGDALVQQAQKLRCWAAEVEREAERVRSEKWVIGREQAYPRFGPLDDGGNCRTCGKPINDAHAAPDAGNGWVHDSTGDPDCTDADVEKYAAELTARMAESPF